MSYGEFLSFSQEGNVGIGPAVKAGGIQHHERPVF